MRLFLRKTRKNSHWCGLFLALALCLCLASCHKRPAGESISREEIALSEEEAVAALLYRSSAEHAPALLLLPDKNCSAAVWEAFALRFQQEGYALMVVDDPHLAGQPWEEAFRRIDAVRERLLQEKVHPLNLAVAGEGAAAGLALLYAAARPDMQAVILVSPGLVYQDKRLESAMESLTDCPSFIAASEGDRYGAQAAQVLKKAAPVYAELRLWPGAAHGTDLFAGNPEASSQILQWLKPILNAP